MVPPFMGVFLLYPMGATSPRVGTPPLRTYSGLLQGPAPVATPTETSTANFLSVFYGHPYNPCVGAPVATASCGLWGCLPGGGYWEMPNKSLTQINFVVLREKWQRGCDVPMGKPLNVFI